MTLATRCCFLQGGNTHDKLSPMERFWKKVRKTDTCWLWEGASRPGAGGKRYGVVQVQRKHWGALQERVAKSLAAG